MTRTASSWSQAQWRHIHEALYSWEPKRVIPLVHPKLGVKVRSVDAAFADDNGWRLKVSHVRWSRADGNFRMRIGRVYTCMGAVREFRSGWRPRFVTNQ
jgi:hypothetical protein